MWEIFKTVNLRIVDFKDWKSKVTLVNAITWGGGAVGLVTSFSGGFDWVAPRLIAYLAGKPELASTWQGGSHWGSKSLVSLTIIVFFYLIVFSVQASVLLTERQPSDFQAELALAIGVRFTRIYEYYDVTNEEGDCYVSFESDLLVGDLPLSHVQRKYGSNSATRRGTPTMEVPVHPLNIEPKTESTAPTTNPRVYHFRFVPPMSHTAETTTVKFTEEVTRGVWMWYDDVPEDRVLGGRLESIGHLINEPTDLLVLEVHFPRRYTVAGDRQFKVRLGSTENPHVREERRLENETALKAEIDRGRQKLCLTVKRPLMGLCYYLCWVPPRKPKQGP